MSPLEENQLKARMARKEKRNVKAYLRWFRPLVHRALKAGKKATKLEQLSSMYRENTEGFQENVAQHKDIFMRRCLFGAVMAFYIVGEWTVACMVASGLIPGLTDVQACAFYVSGFLMVSLAVKALSCRAEVAADARLAELEQGQEATQRKLVLGKWMWAVAKVLVLGAIIISYQKVYEQRINMEEKKLTMARDRAVSAASQSKVTLFGKSEAPKVATATPKDEPSISDKARKMAEGTLVIMGFLVALHAAFLFFPVTGLGSDASLWAFHPTRTETKADRMRGKEEGLLRKIAYTIKDAPEGPVVDALLEAVQPVARRIDALARFDAGENGDAAGQAGRPPRPTPPVSDSGAQRTPDITEAQTSKNESELYKELFGASV